MLTFFFLIFGSKGKSKCSLYNISRQIGHFGAILSTVLSRKNENHFTNLEKIIIDPIILWGYGHLHKKAEMIINGVRVISNPRGYPGEKTGFDPNFYIEF